VNLMLTERKKSLAAKEKKGIPLEWDVITSEVTIPNT
jgi:hypothetical protein